jgi:hypothetical protein
VVLSQIFLSPVLFLKYQNEYRYAKNEIGLKYWFEQFKQEKK